MDYTNQLGYAIHYTDHQGRPTEIPFLFTDHPYSLPSEIRQKAENAATGFQAVGYTDARVEKITTGDTHVPIPL